MNIFSRFWNLIKAFFGSGISSIEANNPELVYENAITERLEKQKELKKAVSGIVFLRNKTENELKEKESELSDIEAQIGVALDEGEDEVALVLLERKNELEPQIAQLEEELEKAQEVFRGFEAAFNEAKKASDDAGAAEQTADDQQI